ncbi:MAG: PorP/SprF family type IX secretion system membrane protein [Ferruginibacter sp.]
MRKFIMIALHLVALAAMTKSYAQQLQTSSLYDMQGVLHNPSMAGVQQYNIAGVTYKSQWSGISGAPKTATAFGSFDLPKQKIGIGGFVYNDKTGPTSRTGLQLSLAKHIVMKNDAKFSIGIAPSIMQYSIDRSKLAETLGDDAALGNVDNKIKFDVAFGVSYTDKRFQLGASVSQLVQSKLDYYKGNLLRTEEARFYRHYYFHGNYNWNVDDVTTITPNFLVIWLPNAPTDFQVGVKVEHNKILWWGVGYKSRQSYILSAGVNISKKITLGYAFNDYITPISTFDGGSYGHEFILRYNFIK